MTSTNVLFLVVGAIIGYVMGLLTNYVQRIRKEPKMELTHEGPRTWLSRFKQLPGITATNLGMFLILCVVVWAAITSQLSSNKVANQQNANTRVVDCSVKFLNDTISALNSRTANTPAQTKANVTLQAAQQKFFASIDPDSPTLQSDYDTALSVYQTAYNDYIAVTNKSNMIQVTIDYPTPTELRTCLNSK